MKKVFFDITKACNANCVYCYTNSGEASNNELTTKEIKQMLDALVDNNVSAISFAGGEPFLRQDILEILEYCKKRIRCSITTNGTIITSNIMKKIIENDVSITVSIDTLDREHAADIRRGIDVDTVCNNIRKLAKNDIIRKKMSLRTTISTININDIISMVDFCNKLGIPNYKINSTNPYGRALHQKGIIPNFDIFFLKLLQVKDYCALHSANTVVELPIEKYLTEQQRKCALGENSMLIDEQGTCYPCAFSNGMFALGNIRNMSIESLIYKSMIFDHNNEICDNCEINRYRKCTPLEH